MGIIIQNDLSVTRVFDYLSQVKNNIVVLRGGTRSSKSFSMSQHMIINKFCKPLNRVYIIVRKTLPALKRTAYKETIDLLDKYVVPYKLNKSELELRVLNNICYFMSLDDPNKAASLSSDEVWMEEAIDFTFNDFMQFWLRARRQIYMSFNPVDRLHWIKTKIVDDAEYDVGEDVSTYKDNIENLLPVQIKNIESLIKKDKNFHRVYALGEWGIFENIIYSDWIANPKIDKEKVKEVTYGIDWGFSKPFVIVKVHWMRDDSVIWEEVIYEERVKDPLTKAKELILPEDRDCEFYGGTDEPGSIEKFFDAGFNIHKAITAVQDGINYCKLNLTGIIGENLIKEARGYKRKEDKDGNAMEEPVKFMDHGMDAGRYGTYSAARNYQSADTLESSFR